MSSRVQPEAWATTDLEINQNSKASETQKFKRVRKVSSLSNKVETILKNIFVIARDLKSLSVIYTLSQ